MFHCGHAPCPWDVPYIILSSCYSLASSSSSFFLRRSLSFGNQVVGTYMYYASDNYSTEMQIFLLSCWKSGLALQSFDEDRVCKSIMSPSLSITQQLN